VLVDESLLAHIIYLSLLIKIQVHPIYGNYQTDIIHEFLPCRAQCKLYNDTRETLELYCWWMSYSSDNMCVGYIRTNYNKLDACRNTVGKSLDFFYIMKSEIFPTEILISMYYILIILDIIFF